MIDTQKYYKILRLHPGASQHEIKQAYRELAKQWHPDRFPNNPEKQQIAEELIKRLNEAYQALRIVSKPLNDVVSRSTPSSQLNTYSTRPTNPERYYNQGAENAKQRDYQNAIDAFTMAIRLNPNYAEAYRYRGLVFSVLGYENRAESDLLKANQLELKQTVESTQPAERHSSPEAQSPMPSSSQEPLSTLQCSWECVHTLIGHSDSVTSVVVVQGNKMLASGSRDGTIGLWNLRTRECFATLEGHSAAVQCLAMSPDGQILASGSKDCTIKLWHLRTGSLIRILAGHSDIVTSVVFTPNRHTLISAGWDHQIGVWDITSGKLIRTLVGHSAPIRAIALSSDSRILVSGGDDQCLKVWDLQTGTLVQTIANPDHQILALAMSRDQQDVLLGNNSGEIQRWTIDQAILTDTQVGHMGKIWAIATQANGELFASGGDDHTVKIWSSEGLQHTLTDHDDAVLAVNFSSDGQLLASASADETIRVWQLESTPIESIPST
ncbi:MAG: DnaJ domain-containing protein [Elainellaceae cyanobacterium]